MIKFLESNSMRFLRLVDLLDEGVLPHGVVFRLRATVPYENIVDFMVVESYDSERGMSILVSSGYKAGLKLVALPIDSGKNSLSIGWLKKNWAHWVYPECPVEEVYVSQGYPVPSKFPPDND